MYCKKCKNLLPENEFICDRCHFDNFFEKELSDDLIIKRTSPKKNNSSLFSVVVLFCILVIGVIFMYSIGETKAISDEKITTITTEQIMVKERNYDFVFSNIKLSYSQLFGNSSNTIFYKNNTDINITINTITIEEYNNILNSNDCLDSKIGSVPTKTYAGDLFYSHIFALDNSYYEIQVNYVNDFNIYSESLQKEITKILNSIMLSN